MTNLTHFSQCIYFTPLHVSSNKCSSSGGSNCVNTSSGIIHSSGWPSFVPVGRELSSLPTGTQNKYIEKSASSCSLTRIKSYCVDFLSSKTSIREYRPELIPLQVRRIQPINWGRSNTSQGRFLFVNKLNFRDSHLCHFSTSATLLVQGSIRSLIRYRSFSLIN